MDFDHSKDEFTVEQTAQGHKCGILYRCFDKETSQCVDDSFEIKFSDIGRSSVIVPKP